MRKALHWGDRVKVVSAIRKWGIYAGEDGIVEASSRLFLGSWWVRFRDGESYRIRRSRLERIS